MTSFENFTFTFSFLHVGRPTKAIDHHSFPHIVDLIFEFATFDTLLLLGQVCREWRSRVDAELYHLHDFRASSRYDSKQQGDDWWKHPKYDYYFETASGKPGKLPDVTRLSGTTKIIDLSYRAMSYGADTRAPIDDMRLPEPRWEVDSDLFRTPFAPHRLVFNNHFDTDLPFDEVPRLVVNYRDDEFYVLGVVGNEVELLVFIVHGGSYRQAADWADDVHLMLKKRPKVLYVADQEHLDVLGDDKNDTGYEFKTLEKYRAEIGERNFAIETNFDTPLSPVPA